MKKSSYIFIIIGVIILALAIYFSTRKPANAPTTAGSGQTAANSQQQNDQPVQINVTYHQHQPFTPQEYAVQQGQQVEINVTSDVADELHFHGYDLHTDLTANQPGSIKFTADKTGRFEFELESLKQTLGVIAVNPK